MHFNVFDRLLRQHIAIKAYLVFNAQKPLTMTKKLLSSLILLAICFQANAQQVTVSPMTPEDFDILLDFYDLDNITNVSIECPDMAWGSMSMSDVDLFAGGAVLLTTGDRENILGPNNSQGASSSSPDWTLVDTDLGALVEFPLHDVCRITFDIVPNQSFLTFNYIFGSEEYPEFTCSSFNDVTGIFLSGSNPDGDDYLNSNVINIPGTDQPVAINSVNDVECAIDGEQCPCNDFYFGWEDADSTNLQYDGFTTPMMSFVPVTPGESYTVKIAIGDATDSALDSGLILFLQSLDEDFQLVSLEGFGKTDSNTGREGCGEIEINASLPMAFDKEVTVEFSFSGEAVEGEDFQSDQTTLVFAPGEKNKVLKIDPMEDILVEPVEDFKVHLDAFHIGIQSLALDYSADFEILDALADEDLPYLATDNQEICLEEEITLEAFNGVSYAWSPSALLSDPTSSNPVFSVNEAGEYTFEVLIDYDDYCPPITKAVTVTVEDCSTGLSDRIREDFTVVSQQGSSLLLVSPTELPAYDIHIFDLSGRLAYSNFIPAGSMESQLDLKELEEGLYILSLSFPNGDQLNRKFQLLD